MYVCMYVCIISMFPVTPLNAALTIVEMKNMGKNFFFTGATSCPQAVQAHRHRCY